MANSNSTTKLLLIILFSFLILLTFFYSSSYFFHLNPPTNNTINHPHHHFHHNLSIFNMISKKNYYNDEGSFDKIEDGLARARAAIREAARTRVFKSEDEENFIPRGPVYRNPYAFQQSHKEMVKRFKIWTYKEGEPPLVHQGPVSYFYGIEGHFIQEMEIGMSSIGKFLASNPNEAHAFFLPFSAVKMRIAFYEPKVYDHGPLNRVALDYINMLAHKYPFWNRSHGADHFMLSCHDWAPEITKQHQKMFKNFMRALCNANTSEGFQPMRDVPIPEVNVPRTKLNQPSLGLPLNQRRIFAFFAGGNHGHVRKFLFEHWSNDEEIQLHEHLPKHQNYFQMLGKSKFCLCPSGYEVASSRIVEAILAECVPVLVKDDYSFPFGDVLDWSRFSIYVPVARIPEIKTILKGISLEKYMELVEGVKSVKWHFTFNRPSKPFDIIHMVLHSVWLRRLNVRLPY